MALIAVDPGVHGCGVAWFTETDTLMTCEYRTQTLPQTDGVREWRTVCEIPEQRGRATNIPARDLIAVALAAGRMVGGRACVFVTPSHWKGQLPKDVQHARMLKVLTPAELHIMNACCAPVKASLRHNVYDAVCLGLVRLGRM
jgi:hypothetical protein